MEYLDRIKVWDENQAKKAEEITDIVEEKPTNEEELNKPVESNIVENEVKTEAADRIEQDTNQKEDPTREENVETMPEAVVMEPQAVDELQIDSYDHVINSLVPRPYEDHAYVVDNSSLKDLLLLSKSPDVVSLIKSYGKSPYFLYVN